MHLAVLQHVPFEGPGYIQRWAEEQGYKVDCYLAATELPTLNAFDLLVVMGGPMGVYDTDQYDWIAGEKAFLQKVVAAEKPIIGFCLGAQMLASVLGAKVYQGNHGREIGYFPIQAQTAADKLGVPRVKSALHWHGDTFDLPKGAERLYSSSQYQNQGFIFNNRVIGLQFHWEILSGGVNALLQHCGDEIDGSPRTQTLAEIKHGQHDGLPALRYLLNYLVGLV